MTLKIANSINEIKDCYSVIKQLRDISLEEFINSVSIQKKAAGYKLIFIKDKKIVVAVAGFRISHSLSWGSYLYIDDLITDEKSRSNGYGDRLIDYLIGYAKKRGCRQLHLDSGVQRFDAHRFYLRKRMNIIAHHFCLSLDK